MPVNAIAMPFSFAAAIDSSSLIDPPRLETGVRFAICDSLSLAIVELLKDLGARARESQNRIYEAGVGVKQKMSELRFGRQARLVAGSNARISSLGDSRSELAFSS